MTTITTTSTTSATADDARATAAQSTTIQPLTQTLSELRDVARVLTTEVDYRHRRSRRYSLETAVERAARQSPAELLTILATTRGMPWAMIGRLTGVSVSAVRKWRQGGAVSPENRKALATLVAFLDLLQAVGPVDEPAGWLGMRPIDGYSITGEDLYRRGLLDDLLDFAAGRLEARDLLAAFDPDWQRKTAETWEIVDERGERVIRRRT